MAIAILSAPTNSKKSPAARLSRTLSDSMKFSLRILLVIVLFFGVTCAIIVSRFAPVEFTLGMKYDRVEDLMKYVGADDISDGMSTYSASVPYPDGLGPNDFPDTGANGNVMWHLPKLNITIGTVFNDDQLIEIDVWNWAGRELDRYHHVLEYDSVSSLKIPILHQNFQSELIEKHNLGVNPPITNGG